MARNPFSGVGAGKSTPSNSQLDDPGHKSLPKGDMKDGPSRVVGPSDGVGVGKFKPQLTGGQK